MRGGARRLRAVPVERVWGRRTLPAGFPSLGAGIPVGEIAEMDGVVRVRPLVDLGRLGFLRVMQFDETRIDAEDPAAQVLPLAPPPLPPKAQ